MSRGPDKIVSNLLEEAPELAGLIKQFIDALPDMVGDFAAAIEQKDWVRLRKLAHDMKGLGGGYGYPMLSDIAERIGLRLHDTQFAALESDLQEMRVLVEHIIEGSQT